MKRENEKLHTAVSLPSGPENQNSAAVNGSIITVLLLVVSSVQYELPANADHGDSLENTLGLQLLGKFIYQIGTVVTAQIISISSSSVALVPRAPLGLPGPRLLDELVEGVCLPGGCEAAAPLFPIELAGPPPPGVLAGEGEAFAAGPPPTPFKPSPMGLRAGPGFWGPLEAAIGVAVVAGRGADRVEVWQGARGVGMACGRDRDWE